MRRTFLLGGAAALLSACSPMAVPFGTPPFQSVVASAAHWNELAVEAAAALRPTLDRSVVLPLRGDSEFSRAFADQLAAALVAQGIAVHRHAVPAVAEEHRGPRRRDREAAAQRVAGQLMPVPDRIEIAAHVIDGSGSGIREVVVTVAQARGSQEMSRWARTLYAAGDADAYLPPLPPPPPPPPLPVRYR